MGLRSHFPQLHAIEHIVLHTVDFAVPALVKVAIKPLPEGMAFGVEIGVEVVHHFALAFYIVQQIFVTYRTGLQTLMGGQLAERWGGVGDDGIDGADLIDGIKLGLVINGTLVGPINVGNKGGIRLLEMEVFRAHPISSVDGCGSAHT